MKNKSVVIVILAVLVVLLVGIIWLYASVWNESSLINSFGDCVKAGGSIMESYPRQCLFEGQTFVEEISLETKAQMYCGTQNVVEVNICGTYIAVTSSLLGGGIKYVGEDGSEFSCPVVGPDSMSPECRTIFDKQVSEEWVCSNVC